MEVEVEYTIREDVVDVNDILGGVRIRIDGESIVKVVDEESVDSHYEWKPQYAGQYIQTELQRLVNEAKRIAEGKTHVYERTKVAFPPGKEYFVLEPLSENNLGVAYRIEQSSNVSGRLPMAVPDSACGYVVDRCEFCQSISDAAHEYLDELRSMPLEWGLGLLEEFEESLAELDQALETCEKTPPALNPDARE